MQWPCLKGRIKVAVEPRRLQSTTGEPENRALPPTHTPYKPVKPIYHQTIDPALETETGVHGGIKTRFYGLLFIINRS